VFLRRNFFLSAPPGKLVLFTSMKVGSSTPDQIKAIFQLLDELERRVAALSPSSVVVDLILELRNELTQTLVATSERTP
jgi:hypothetical protein